ncbi:ATP-NAD kinase family protein [Nonomuraea soli]|uniref:Putative polyphosphate/ATP-dependent NAD kinase n=1 Tax=Nonomuraea soli TaxID=1032476 RepID=A0A7W0CM29_9ACTN|nr:ATP-NAD kinase family protein [Nonomuraea soli]MBA2893658.1 putative polyphosphate/ATP-dependent NAD kinase [Nonomuraea soli]
MTRVGLVVNPVAGIGGPAGLKGSDGPEVQRAALARGATPRAGERAALAVRTLRAARPDVEIVAAPGPMGEDLLAGEAPSAALTTAADTRAAVHALRDVGLLLFAGGDGTARDVLDAVRELAELGCQAPPVLGIPAGVKVYSGCFALSPAAAGLLAAEDHDEYAEADVVDLDEELYRQGRVSPRLYGTLRVPAARHRLSGRKASTPPGSVEAIAREVVARMEPGTPYVLGPGATTQQVGRQLGLATTLLGVDVVENGSLVAADVTERDLYELAQDAVVVLSAIGGQGFVLGRGNQQISPRVLGRTKDLLVLATQQKLAALNGRPLLVDTGEEETDSRLSGHVRVITGYRESVIYRMECT